jgi:hypothetical protein
MKRLYVRLTSVLALSLLLFGCTSPQLYATGQAYQRNQCEQMPGKSERESCLGRTGENYDRYKQDAGPDKR